MKLDQVCTADLCWDAADNRSVACPLMGGNCSDGNCACPPGLVVSNGACASPTHHIKVWGAGGGGGEGAAAGGAGGFVEGEYLATEGEILQVVVGTGGGAGTGTCGKGRAGKPNGAPLHNHAGLADSAIIH